MKLSALTIWELRKPAVGAKYFSHKGNGTACIIIKTYVLHSRLFKLCYSFQGI